MNLRSIIQHTLFLPLVSGLTAALCGVLLWLASFGEPLVNASYDSLFRFHSRTSSHPVVIIQLDNAAYAALGQKRGEWDRKLHAQLLGKLKEDGCSIVVFDILFRSASTPETDTLMTNAFARRPGHVVLMAGLVAPEHPGVDSAKVDHFYEPFRDWVEWGIGHANANVCEVVRRHWPFPAPHSSFPSLGWTAARLAGADLPSQPQEQWLRYYAENEAWQRYSFDLALSKPRGFFTNAIVFIGSQPEDESPAIAERDKFLTPQSKWDYRAVGGVDVMATTFLNLMNRDWLKRPPPWLEVTGLLLAAGALGAGMTASRLKWAVVVMVGLGVLAFVGAMFLSHYSDYWFPWLIVTAGQMPVALLFAVVKLRSSKNAESELAHTVLIPRDPLPTPLPEAPDYHFVVPAFGEGAFGKVWLVRNAIGQWQALKAIYQAKFGENKRPYEAEFHGIQRYKPISNQHLGLLTVDFVSTQKPEGYFYYVMELGDSATPDWESTPESYKPLDLSRACAARDNKRLPVAECLRIGIVLADALAFLHDQDLTHRDIKPSNIIFVKGQPRLADVGLVTAARNPDATEATIAGTLGYMPPGEPTGTKQADIYALGMVLYVISTGRQPCLFPELKTSLVMDSKNHDFMFLNRVILRACETSLKERYASAGELKHALMEVEERIGTDSNLEAERSVVLGSN